MSRRIHYRIVVNGQLSRRWAEWLNNFDIHVLKEPDGQTITALYGPVVDQAALRGILCKLWDLNLTVISVGRIERDYSDEEVDERMG